MRRKQSVLVPVIVCIVTGVLMASSVEAFRASAEGKVMSREDFKNRKIIREGKALEVMQKSDYSSPFIRHDVVSGAEKGRPITISASVTDKSGVMWVNLYYRPSDRVRYTKLEMESAGEGAYEGNIPDYVVIDRGVEYYISAVDILGNGPAYSGTERYPHEVVFGSPQPAR